LCGTVFVILGLDIFDTTPGVTDTHTHTHTQTYDSMYRGSIVSHVKIIGNKHIVHNKDAISQ